MGQSLLFQISENCALQIMKILFCIILNYQKFSKVHIIREEVFGSASLYLPTEFYFMLTICFYKLPLINNRLNLRCNKNNSYPSDYWVLRYFYHQFLELNYRNHQLVFYLELKKQNEIFSECLGQSKYNLFYHRISHR